VALQSSEAQQSLTQPGQQQQQHCSASGGSTASQQEDVQKLQWPPLVLCPEADMQTHVFDDSVFECTLIAQQLGAASSKAAASVLASRGSPAHVTELLQSYKGISTEAASVCGRPNALDMQQLASARSVSECLAVVLACTEIQQLPHLLQATGERVCAFAPVSACCNNPHCTNMSCNSELQLVQGRAAQCRACGSAR
jgi:hypothetical protein